VCDAGRYNENRAHGLWPSAPACKACAKGKFAGSKSTKLCEDCPAGHFMTGQAATECQPCKAGYYNPSKGQSAAHDDSCIPCPKGAYCPEGSAAFIKCNPGFQQPILYATKESDCKKCEKGTYAGTAQTETCEECGAGYYQDQEAKDDCKECPAGTAQPLDKRTLLSECESCHLGKYQPHKARSFCLNCSQGRYQDEKKQLSCKGCPSGQFGLKKDDGKDHMRIGLTEGCEECGFGKYQEQEGKNGCTECDVGTASAEIGAHDRVVCKTCEAGQFADSPATKTCKLCKPGRHGPTDNTQVHDEDLHCIHCPHGHYQEKDGSTKCEVCEAGKFTGVEHCNSDKSKCTFTATTGHATCVDCPQVDALRTWTSDAGANSCRKDPVPAVYSPWTEYLHPNGYTDHATGTCSIKCQNDGGWDDGVYVPRTEPGYQTKTRVPVDPGADNGVTCGLDEKAHCLWSWGFDGPLSDKPNYDSLSETRQCNHGEDEGDYTGVGYCPRDCTVTEWLPWSTCTQSCGTGGMTYRQRHVKHPAAHGGSCDKHFDEDAECNRVSCKAPYCHDKHVQCKVQTKNFGLGCSNIFGCGAHDVDGINADGLATPRCNTWHNHRLNCHLDSTAQDEASGVQANWKQIEKTDENPWTASEKCDNDRTCHMCSSEAECALKGMHETIVVTHNRKYMCSTYGKECNRPNSGEHSAAYEEDEIEQLTDAFHCERVCKNGDSFEEIIHARLTKTHANEKYTSKYMLPKESRAECQFCKCRCKKHPPCYGKTGQDLSNTIILGNHWQLIAKRQDCCNMCTNHPQCGSFTYEADGGHCKLYTGTAVFKASDNAGIFAGCKFGDKCGTEQVTASVMA